MAQQYEILYIVPAQYTEEELIPVKEKIRAIIEKCKGKVSREDNLGKRKLAYPIKKFHQGYYLLFEFEMEPVDTNKLESELRLTDEVIRHLIVKTTPRLKATYDMLKKRMAERAEAAKAAAKTAEEAAQANKEDEKDKIKLEDLDQKLDELLETDNLL